ncbi:hypothetical protein [Bizionia paragorgiae]|uniref:Lipoprotein n=1 Tax=Bizionia paragorgiae TaxID=283786 RepID=A0A1H3VUM2_BIZPA|nr:hypothetical protein [Bizionia paragorgiae]SDZ78391.1 hypothetical protein SAMN04487990_10241 [Bizionia paragorgiae]
MKTITILLFTIILNACGASTEASKAAALTDTQAKMEQSEDLSLEYEAVTRGTYKNITIKNRMVSWVNERNAKPQVVSLDDKQWESLVTLVNAVDLTSIPKLEAPSKAHQYDGAPIGSLTVSKNGETYKTQAFDAGNPHADLVEVIEQMMALTNGKK